MLTSRIEKLKEDLFIEKRKISLERATLYTESYRETEGEPSIIRRAKALEKILLNSKIKISDGELIVGGRTVEPRAGVISPEMSPYWILEELDTFPTRPQDKFEISEEDKKYFKEFLYPYWKGKSLKDDIDKILPEHIKEAARTKIISLNQTDKGQGHIIPQYDLVLEKGLDFLIDEIKNKTQDYPENDFYKASLISLEASKEYILRYAKLAEQLAAVEKNNERKLELQKIAKVCNNISSRGAEDFYEAIQLFWFLNIIFQHESNASSISPGRFDQYMFPYFNRSLNIGEDKDFLKELLRCLYIKFNSIVAVRSEESARFFGGFPIGYTIVLSGQDEQGKDATNELSYIMLDILGEIRLPQPNMSIRVSEKSPREFLIKAAEIIRIGTGMPQVFNDEVNILAYSNRGVELKDARDYAVVGCVELSIPGKTYGLHDIALFNLLKVMEVTLKENNEKVTSFEELMDKIKEKVSEYVEYMVKGSNIVDLGHKEFAPTPFLSNFVQGTIESGKDITDGGAKYNFSGVQGIGIANLSDSLYVIKKVVFEEKEFTLPQLVKILDENYENNEVLRQRFINKFSKYGNDNTEVDELSSDILTHYCDEVSKYRNIRDGIFQPGSYTVSAHIPLGGAVGATADGRKAGDQLADGGLSPMVGRDRLGPTASLKSVSKLDNYLTSNGSLLNVKFSPSTLEGNSGIMKLVGYMQAFMRLKIQHIQFNVVSVDTLKDAQKHPEKYQNLVVRVAGYSAIFVELDKAIQDDIINRTEHQL
ncbi:formate C-acetyltransferase [Clostridium sp. 'White wine YQ']|uniref:formate C-acetyltransferase n=1 Tax=Clostridium sp. 'White wine YQ' TaxID=3027474 RepID=UPI0023655785|nr:formate C-acetyltransferase [Clostridium sp. 'White wine YQ']MDD7795800.1 formate C-acetyltransferase [Clostridium sp. 'White wine YQ']